MNYGIIRSLVGKIMILVAVLMLLPLIIALGYSEGIKNILSFLIPIAFLIIVGYLLSFKKPKKTTILAREGFIIVGLSWVLISLFGCLPFIISQEIPNFFTAFFEMASGFTTTGSSALTADQLDSMSHSMLFWRSFSHWIGGMGILVFILAIIPESKDGSAMHILRAESPGPQVGKLVSKMQVTSRILYIIYIALTLLEFILLMLMFDPFMKGASGNDNWFNSLLLTFGTAGTGGFAPFSAGCGALAARSQYVIAIFMIIFGINFSMFYLILIGNFKEVLKNEELRVYLIAVVVAVAVICFNIRNIYNTFEESFRHSLFQVASIISTTGYSTTDYAVANQWPILAQIILATLTVTGACAGSTAGGLKTSRVIILTKTAVNKCESSVNPRKIKKIRMDGKALPDEMVSNVVAYFLIWGVVLILCTILISIYNPNMPNMDFTTAFTASLTCISNVGPGLGNIIGPAGNFADFSSFSKVILAFEMITGRLELFPMLLLFNPTIWKKRI